MRDFDAFDAMEMSPEHAGRVIGGTDSGAGTGTPSSGLPDKVITWIEGVICNPLGGSDPDDTETISFP
ncbi:MAG: hypothetical protein JWM27_2743 [Gemmatimonadetes bacterium]|nr:hypothetical protein [Gemmatimonadota bacterium]